MCDACRGRLEAAAERRWEGASLKLPHAEIALADLRVRCVMTTDNPDTARRDPDVLRDIVRRVGGRLCLNAQAARAGRLPDGDAVELLSHSESLRSAWRPRHG